MSSCAAETMAAVETPVERSGSSDIVVKDAFVPSYRALNIDRAGVDDWTGWELHHRLTYRVPLRVMLAWDLVAPLLGIAQGAVVMRQRVNWVLEKARRGEAF